jgi:hypothetical protein
MSANLSDLQELTVEPVQPGNLPSLSTLATRFTAPEFLDADGVETNFGLKKSILYRLLSENRIRAVSIRKRGTTRGKRLFDCGSIRRFLNANVDRDGENQKSPEA